MKNFLNSFIKRIDAVVILTAIGLITAGVYKFSAGASMITLGTLLLIDVYLSKVKGKSKR